MCVSKCRPNSLDMSEPWTSLYLTLIYTYEEEMAVTRCNASAFTFFINAFVGFGIENKIDLCIYTKWH